MDVTDVVGSMGRSQMKIFLVMLLRPLPPAFLIYATFFSLIQDDHWCTPSEALRNLTSAEWKNCCVPKTSADESFSKCEHYDFDETGSVLNSSTVACDHWDYDRTGYYKSMRTDWNLVCYRGWYVSMLYLSFKLGNLLSYLPAGHIADRYGRKPVCLVGPLMGATVSLISAFSTSVGMMLVLRLLLGVSFGIYQSSFICLFLEAVGPEHRNWVVVSFGGSWGLSIMVVAVVAYFVKDWSHLLILGSFPLHLPVLILFWWLVPESSRWLLSVKRYDEAEKQIVKIAKENGRPITDTEKIMEQLKAKVEQDKEQQGKLTILDLLKDRLLLRITLVLCLSFVLTVFINHGFTLSVGHLGGSLHLNVFLSGAIEIVALGWFYILVKWTTRRRGLLISFVLAGLMFLLAIPIGQDLQWLRIMIAMVGRLCNSTAYNILYVFASEIFPTSLRAVGVSGGMSAGRIGSILGSFTDDLGRVYGRSAPLILYGVLSLVTSAVFLLLPETSNRHLPDTVAETKMLASKQRASNVEMTPSVSL